MNDGRTAQIDETAPSAPCDLYTDEPRLHPHFLVGSLQLLGWLFFRPTAWRAHLARIDRTLSPIFSLADLDRKQWRNPALRRFLLQCGLLVLLFFPLHALSRANIGLPLDDLTYDFASYLGGSVLYFLGLGPALQIAALAAFVVTDALGLNGYILTPLFFGISASVGGNLLEPVYTISFTRRLGGLVTGIFLGSLSAALLLVFAMLTQLTFPLGTGSVGFGGLLGLLLGLGLGWRTRAWRRAGLIGLGLAAFIIVLSNVPLDGANPLVENAVSGLLATGTIVVFYILAVAISQRNITAIAGAWTGLTAGLLALAIADSMIYASFFNGSLGWSAGLQYLWLFPLGLTLTWWRPVVLYPFLTAWNTLLFYAELRRAPGRLSLLRWHSAGWDELQRLPLRGLDDHLLIVLARHPAEGQAALDYLARGHQRWAAQAAQVELDARSLERCASVTEISAAAHQLAVGELAGSANALLRSFSRLSQDVAAALQLVNTYHQRLALRTIEDQLDGLLRELTRSNEAYAQRFRPIAVHWRRLIAEQRQALVQIAERHQEIDNPYVVGVPLSAQQAVFVGRTELSARLETLLLDRQCPPLLLYGQRRIGKTSLLNNLGRLIAQDIVPLYVDLQGPVGLAANHTGFLAALARALQSAAQQERKLTLPPLSRADLETDPFPCFDAWLDMVAQVLAHRTALLMLDEFEVLEFALASGRLHERSVLGMLRHMIQHRPWLKVLFAGSHTLDEVQRWSSYLINVQVIPISYLSEEETRQLVEHPVEDFVLRYTPEASARVFTLTRGHPALVQLLCTAIIAAKNRQPLARRRLADLADILNVIPETLQRGSLFFADIERNQLAERERAVLRTLAQQGEAAVLPAAALGEPAGLEQALSQLMRRDLIEAVAGGYRFQVELIRRWFSGQPDVQPSPVSSVDH
ncbi:hypothetical protein TFLX_02614 [Thermoflexales bacterium]|nr:hypothetical protein TFLX_02614 [Thermoflexales bacterium]